DEEVQALNSIYGDDWSVESEVARTYRVRIRELAHVVLLVVTMSPGYPGQAPPEYELSAPWMDRAAKTRWAAPCTCKCSDNGEAHAAACYTSWSTILQKCSDESEAPYGSNQTTHDEEVQALNSIYGDDWSAESEVARTYRVRIRELAHVVLLIVTMSPGYPGQAPPEYELSAPWMDRAAKTRWGILARLKSNWKIANVIFSIIFAYRIDCSAGHGVALSCSNAVTRAKLPMEVTRGPHTLVGVTRW
ncbi:protein IMPACT-like, partial [Ostrinia furnacalis]|uniref:protein IMPACT-like n=1 Tax=Ostrinia furnacalis TaxID=93504 RepID=UPI00103D6EC3